MKHVRCSIILFALLLAAGAMIPFVTAENVTNSSGTGLVVSENGTVILNGIIPPVTQSKDYPLNTSGSNTPLTREQFMAANQRDIEFLTEKFGKEQATQMVNDEYDRSTNSSTCAGSTPDGEDILSIDPVGNHAVGENFYINGTAILPAGVDITITIYRGSFSPGIPPQRDPWYDHIPTTVRVKYYNKTGNIWSYTINTTGSYPDEYIVSVQYPRDSNVNATAIFNLVPVGENVKSGSGTTNKNVNTINPIGDHAVGDVITITGTTNFPVNTTLWVSAGPRTFTNYEPNYFDGQTQVMPGTESNLWSIVVNTSKFSIDEYTIHIEPINENPVFSFARFNITPKHIGSSRSTLQEKGSSDNSSPKLELTTSVDTLTPESAPFPIGIIMGSLLCATFLTARRMR